jgi:hypothetical protein
MDGVKGKGGYWTIDPTHMEKFKNGSFARGSSNLLRRKPNHTPSNNATTSPPPPTSIATSPATSTSTATVSDSSNSQHTLNSNNNTIIHNTASTEPLPAMQIHNLLN